MALNIIFGGKQYAALENTTVYPSGNANVRSRMEIHMAEDAMALEAFVALVSDEANTMNIRLVGWRDVEGSPVVDYDTAYTYFVIVSEVGKKRVDTVDNATGAVTSEYHLVAVLEQLTYIEQQLHKLGL